MFNGFLRQGSSANQTVATAIGGGYSLTKTGTGTLTLSGANTFTGGMTINAGKVAVAAAGGLGTNGVTINADGTLEFTIASGALNCTRVLSGAGALAKTAAGVVALQAANPFSGTISISSGDFVFDNINAAQGKPAIVLSGSGRLLLASAFAGNTCTISSLTGAAGNTVYTAYAATTGTRRLAVEQAGDTTYAGLLTDASGSRFLALTKAGVGSLTLSGASTYTGGTIINGGTIVVGHLTALGTGGVTVNAGATLNKNGFAIANAVTNNGGTVLA